MWVVGLGNPGRRYAGTRHNVGQAVVRRLVERWRAEELARERSFRAWRARLEPAADAGEPGPEVMLVTPLSYMNRSGEALADFTVAGGERPAPEATLVVCDDIYLPPGELRLRAQGSAGGHRGLESVERFFGTPAYARLRIGVGRGGGDLTEHVLSDFGEGEQDAIAGAQERAGEAVEIWAREGILAAMNRFNRRVREVSP